MSNPLEDGWQKVTFTDECDPDGTGWCHVRNTDPAECSCIGPTQDGYEYMIQDHVLYGRLIKEDPEDVHGESFPLGLAGQIQPVKIVGDPATADHAELRVDINGEMSARYSNARAPGLTNPLLAEKKWTKGEIQRLRGIIARVVMNDESLAIALKQNDVQQASDICFTMLDECHAEVASWSKSNSPLSDT